MRLLPSKSNFAKNHCKIPMAALVPFLMFGCSGGKTAKTDAGEKPKDVRVQTTGSDEQRKLAMAATAVPGVSVSAVFGADADKLMAFGLKELGKSADSLSLAGPVYKLSATAELTPGSDGCFAILPVTSGSICFDERISATRFLIPSEVPGTSAVPNLGLAGNAVKYSSLYESCLKAGPNNLCFVDQFTPRNPQPVPPLTQATQQYRAVPPTPVTENQVAVIPQALPKERTTMTMPVPIPAGQPRAVAPVIQEANPKEYIKRPSNEGYDTPRVLNNKIPSGLSAEYYRAVPPPVDKEPNRVDQSAESNTGDSQNQGMPGLVALPKLPQEIHNDLEQLRIQKLKEEEDRRFQESLALAEEQDRINNEERLRQEVWHTVLPDQIPEPVYSMPETMSKMPEVTEVLIDTANEKGSPTESFQLPGITGAIDPDAGIKQPSETVSDPSESVVEVGEKTLLQLPPRDCSVLKCAQPIPPVNCEHPQLKTPPGECCAQFVCAGGYSTPNGQDCRPELCPRAMPALNCIGPKLEAKPGECCPTLVCTGGFSTPSCKTVGCPEGKECIEMCASCMIGADKCPEFPCTSTCM